MDDTQALAILARENIRVSRDWIIILPPGIDDLPGEVFDAVQELLWEWDFDCTFAYDSASWTGRRTYCYSDASPWAAFKRWWLGIERRWFPTPDAEIDAILDEAIGGPTWVSEYVDGEWTEPKPLIGDVQ